MCNENEEESGQKETGLVQLFSGLSSPSLW